MQIIRLFLKIYSHFVIIFLMKKKIIALMYDFDRTLATQDMQNFDFIPSLGLTIEEFWEKTNIFCEKNNTDRILGYMFVMLDECKKRNIKLTYDYLKDQGKHVDFYKGVLTWFDRINKYAESKGFKCEHYLISSGNKEIVDGTALADKFTHIFGCEYFFDKTTKEAIWPKFMVNYTQKTQCFYKISKGATQTNYDDVKVNQKVNKRRIPYRNMIYLGDGITDVPIMILTKNNGGTSIAVYNDSKNKEKVEKLLQDSRVNFICKADYSENKAIDKVVKLTIDSIAIQDELIYKYQKDDKIKKV